jgi:hypothetical protein
MFSSIIVHYRAAKDGYLWRKGAERTKWKYAEDWVATHGDSWSIMESKTCGKGKTETSETS